MKHSQKKSRRISKKEVKNRNTWVIILFFVIVMLFQRNSASTEFQFIRNDNEMGVHAVANDNPPPSQRDYLFQNEAGNDVYQGQITDGQRRTEVVPPSIEENKNTTISGNANIQISGTTQGYTGQSHTWNFGTWSAYSTGYQTGQIHTWDLGTWKMYVTGETHSWTIQTETEKIQTGENSITEILTWVSNCISPWEEIIRHKDFVLAYQQRKDVSSMCNIEKRVCNNGVLWWSFIQRSCKEDITYEYRKTEVISYNQKVLNEYIQPVKPKNIGAEFNNQWKIDATSSPTNTRGTENIHSTSQWETNQTPLPSKASCITPREQKIEHGQFIKAYKAPRGFIDLACEVELRPCIDGKLKGAFAHPKCIFNNTSYGDYMNAGGTQESRKFLFFEWIKWLIKR